MNLKGKELAAYNIACMKAHQSGLPKPKIERTRHVKSHVITSMSIKRTEVIVPRTEEQEPISDDKLRDIAYAQARFDVHLSRKNAVRPVGMKTYTPLAAYKPRKQAGHDALGFVRYYNPVSQASVQDQRWLEFYQEGVQYYKEMGEGDSDTSYPMQTFVFYLFDAAGDMIGFSSAEARLKYMRTKGDFVRGAYSVISTHESDIMTEYLRDNLPIFVDDKKDMLLSSVVKPGSTDKNRFLNAAEKGEISIYVPEIGEPIISPFATPPTVSSVVDLSPKPLCREYRKTLPGADKTEFNTVQGVNRSIEGG